MIPTELTMTCWYSDNWHVINFNVGSPLQSLPLQKESYRKKLKYADRKKALLAKGFAEHNLNPCPGLLTPKKDASLRLHIDSQETTKSQLNINIISQLDDILDGIESVFKTHSKGPISLDSS